MYWNAVSNTLVSLTYCLAPSLCNHFLSSQIKKNIWVVSLIKRRQKHISKSCMSTFQKFGKAFLRLKLLKPGKRVASRSKEMIMPDGVATLGMLCPALGCSLQEGHGIPGAHWRATKMFRPLEHNICEERRRDLAMISLEKTEGQPHGSV